MTTGPDPDGSELLLTHPALSAVMSALDRVESGTGKRAFCAVKVTAGADAILERAEEAVEHGANMMMIEVLACSFSALQGLARGL